MQWTPSNRTVPQKPPPEIPTSFDAIEYKAYTPYVAPLPRSLNPPPPQLPAAFVSEKPDPLTLPGFSSISPDASISALAAPNGATANVVTEDAQPYSLLNLYRHLIRTPSSGPHALRRRATLPRPRRRRCAGLDSPPHARRAHLHHGAGGLQPRGSQPAPQSQRRTPHAARSSRRPAHAGLRLVRTIPGQRGHRSARGFAFLGEFSR